MKDRFIISNITEKDIEKHLLRIVVDNKKYFPGSDNIEPKKYKIKVKVNSEIYDATYRVGKQRSGTLRIGAEIYKDRLGLEHGDILTVEVLEDFGLYELKRGKRSL